MKNFDVYAALRIIFCRVFCPCEHKEDRPQARVTLAVGSIAVTCIPKGKIMFSLPDDKTADASVAYVDAKNQPAKVDGAPVWSSSDDTVATVAASSDGMSAVVTPVNVGQAQIKVEADADLGSGVVPVVSLVDVEVIAGQAVAGNVSLALTP
jgi:uncharacterized protein YjdB